jgi:tetratricopeptide (TPR) repeat protein
MAWAGPSDDSDREAARVATKQATAAFNLGHYDEAASLYEEAYKHVPDPILLYDLGQSYRQANKLDKALIAYRSYLRTAPDDAPIRAKVQQWVGELEWTSEIQAKAAAQKAAQKERAPTPVVPAPVVPAPVVPAPVVPVPVVSQPPEPQISQPQVPPASTPARTDLVSQAPKVEEAQPSASWKKWAPWVGVGITAALGVATMIEGLSARSS